MKTLILLLSELFWQCISPTSFAQAMPPLKADQSALAPALRSLETPSNKAIASDGPCSLKTLLGTYVFGYEGTIDSGVTPVRQSGIEVFDGKGNVTGKSTTRVGALAAMSMQTLSFSYTVNPDCTGHLSNANGTYADIFVDPTGGSFQYIFTSSSQQISGETKRASKRVYGGL